MRAIVGVAMGLAVALGGCSWFGDDEPEAPTAAVQPAAPVGEAVQAVRRIELGSTRKGVVVAAFGTAPGLGYSRPRLVARRNGEPASDGLLDFDFVLDPPPPGLDLPQGTPRAREVRADTEISLDTARRARGVRVHAIVGGVQLLF